MTNETLTSRQAAAILCVGLRRLQNMRRRRELLPVARNKYRLADCQAWLKAETQKWSGNADLLPDGWETSREFAIAVGDFSRQQRQRLRLRRARIVAEILLTRPFSAVSGENPNKKDES